jgi:hypothetical protein
MPSSDFVSPYFNTIDASCLPDYALRTRTVLRLENWEVPLSADQAGKSAVEPAAGPSVKQDTTAIQLWDKTNSQLEKALGYYDKLGSDSLPEKAWLRASKASYQQQIDQILDAVIKVLEVSGAADCRKEIKTIHQAIRESHQRIADYREQRLSALPEASRSKLKIWKPSSESLEESIIDEERKIAELRRQIDQLKGRFRNELQQIGVEVYDDEIDSLLMPVTQDDIVSMAAVISNIASLTNQLERLTEESKELPSQTQRYYGMYLLLVYAIDRIQARFIQEVDHVQLPKLHAFAEDARQNISEAKNQIAGGGPKEQLRANIDAANTTIDACRCLSGALRDQKNAIARENEQTKRMLGAAINTYKTVRLSLNVADLMRDCEQAFHALRQLRLPRLRTFQNLQLKTEIQRLTERMLDREA